MTLFYVLVLGGGCVSTDAPAENDAVAGAAVDTEGGDTSSAETRTADTSPGSDADPSNPCSGVTCSGHGTCFRTSSRALCNCDDGYHAEGLECVENDSSNPCNGVHCGSHGECAANQGAPTCRCDVGYMNEGTQCVPVGIWKLPAGADTWERYPIDPANTQKAPAEPIRAAFDIEDRNAAFVLTDSTYRVFQPDGHTWKSAKSLADWDDPLADGDILLGLGTPADHGDNPEGHDTVAVAAVVDGSVKHWIGEYQPSSETIAWTTEGRDAEPRTREVAPPSLTDETAAWVDLEDARDWATASPKEICGSEKDVTATDTTVYLGVVAVGKLFIHDSGHCGQYVQNYEYMNSPLAQLNSAPPSLDDVGAAFFHAGDLFLFRGE